jgi:protein-tyrosine phosphatase
VLAVLFVCTGNICRSPLAEGFLADRSHRLLDGAIEVGSAGTWASAGRPPTPESVAAGGDRGVDISGLRATSFRGALAREADLVLTMTREQEDEVLAQARGAGPKTFTLKEAVALFRALPPPEGRPDRDALLERIAGADRLRGEPGAPQVPDADVSDPLGMSPEIYRAVAWEIEGLVDELVEGLFGPVGARPTGMSVRDGGRW